MKRVCVFVFMAALVLAHVSLAQERSREWDFSIWVAPSTGEELTNSFGEAQLWSAGVFVGRALTPEIGRHWWRGRVEGGFNLIPVLVQARPQLIYGGGVEPLIFRWNSSIRLRQLQPYIELGGGALWATTNLPSGDTSYFNFTAKGGGGFYIPLRDHLVDIGVRWSHISNANLGRRNPEFNGIELRLGYHWMK